MARVGQKLAAVVGAVGAAFIYALIRAFGRRIPRAADVPWLRGPLGGETIGERCYEEKGLHRYS